MNRRNKQSRRRAPFLSIVLLAVTATGTGVLSSTVAMAEDGKTAHLDNTRLDSRLTTVLQKAGFTGKIESTLEPRLGRKLDLKLADLGRLLFFDVDGGLHNDNTCAGCHSPAVGMGDTQSIAIGVQNNGIVGPDRAGPRNQRRTPSVINTPFYPSLMWNSRFSSLSGDPFDNSKGFLFPEPEGTVRFPPNDPIVTHLSIAQAHMPPTELIEVAGFNCTKGTIGPRFDQFDDGLGACLPPADASGTRNDPIRHVVLGRLNGSANYRRLFGQLFPTVAAGGLIDFTMFARAIAEFEFTIVRANAPIDKFARGDHDAMGESQKRGALVFFGKGGCVACHAVAGKSNEMFSDFQMHTIAVPQLAPGFGAGVGNVIFSGPGENEDFGREEFTGNTADRYKFRTSPLRNAILQPAFFHNGSFTRLSDAIRHHLDVFKSARNYSATRAGVDRDLRNHLGPIEPVLEHLDPLLATPIRLDADEFHDLVNFVGGGLLDERAQSDNLCKLIPKTVPSGRPVLTFQGCKQDDDKDDRD